MAIKSQSAMEYLMTYGWAILAIAIVMVSLYSLGIFNTGNLQPTATPGSCKVVRTVAQTSLAGQCSNLIPKYVGGFNGKSYAQASDSASLRVGDPSFTFSAWIYPTSLSQCSSGCQIFNKEQSYEWWINSSGQLGWAIRNSNPGWNSVYTQIQASTGKWTYIVLTYNGSYVNAYSNGVADSGGPHVATGNVDNTNYRNATRIGARGAPGAAYQMFYGSIANVQIYNTTLDASSIKALYQEGIGGAPINLQHVVAWWSLNGDTNDYSGNNNQGTSYNVTWNANWQSGYTAPTT